MKSLSHFAHLLASMTAIALCVSAITVRAADADVPRSETPAEVRARVQEMQRKSVISIDFPGGSIAQLLDLISKSDGPAFNLVGEKADFATELPPFSIRDAIPSGLYAALNPLLRVRGFTIIPPNSYSNGHADVYSLVKLENGNSPTEFDSIQLAPYLERQSIDDIVGAIRLAWEMNPKHIGSALSLKFHPPTKILLVAGPAGAIELTRQVIGSLQGAPKPPPGQDSNGATTLPHRQ